MRWEGSVACGLGFSVPGRLRVEDTADHRGQSAALEILCFARDLALIPCIGRQDGSKPCRMENVLLVRGKGPASPGAPNTGQPVYFTDGTMIGPTCWFLVHVVWMHRQSNPAVAHIGHEASHRMPSRRTNRERHSPSNGFVPALATGCFFRPASRLRGRITQPCAPGAPPEGKARRLIGIYWAVSGSRRWMVPRMGGFLYEHKDMKMKKPHPVCSGWRFYRVLPTGGLAAAAQTFDSVLIISASLPLE